MAYVRLLKASWESYSFSRVLCMSSAKLEAEVFSKYSMKNIATSLTSLTLPDGWA